MKQRCTFTVAGVRCDYRPGHGGPHSPTVAVASARETHFTHGRKVRDVRDGREGIVRLPPSHPKATAHLIRFDDHSTEYVPAKHLRPVHEDRERRGPTVAGERVNLET